MGWGGGGGGGGSCDPPFLGGSLYFSIKNHGNGVKLCSYILSLPQ